MSTELTTIERAEQVLGFVERKAQLAELAGKSVDIKTITNTAGFQECHAARMRLKNERVLITKLGKDARDDATKFSSAVIAKEKELIAVIAPEEDRLQGIQDAYETARAAERAELERRARERVEAIRKRIDDIKGRPFAVVGQAADVIRAAIENLQAVDFADLPPDAQTEAACEKDHALERLIELHEQRVRTDAERAELDQRRLAQEQEEQQARERREREEAEQRVRLAGEERARRDQEESERAERQRQEDAARAERDREAAEADERRRIEDERLKAERDALDRDRRERERAAREKEIAEATLYGAACEAIDLLNEHGLAEHIVTKKLEAALGREKPIKEAA